MVDCDSIDDNISRLTKRINEEPGLEQFQPFLRASSTIVQRSQYANTKFKACASNSKHGYWEVYGHIHAASTTPKDDKGDDEIEEVAIFTADPQIATNKSAGSVLVSPKATLTELRALVADQVELPSELEQFRFVRLGGPSTGPKVPLVMDQDESTVKIRDVMVLGRDKDARIRISKAQVLPRPSLFYVVLASVLTLIVGRRNWHYS